MRTLNGGYNWIIKLRGDVHLFVCSTTNICFSFFHWFIIFTRRHAYNELIIGSLKIVSGSDKLKMISNQLKKKKKKGTNSFLDKLIVTVCKIVYKSDKQFYSIKMKMNGFYLVRYEK